MDAAHLLDVAGAVEPSFFELIAQQSMSSVLGPALRYLCTVRILYVEVVVRVLAVVKAFDLFQSCHF